MEKSARSFFGRVRVKKPNFKFESTTLIYSPLQPAGHADRTGIKSRKLSRFINSEVRYVHFHVTIIEKPIPSCKVFIGDVFELVDQALDFVLSKQDYCVVSRSQEISIPEKYEITKEIVAEAIVNAVAHRDYINNGSIQVILFSNHKRKNPASLP